MSRLKLDLQFNSLIVKVTLLQFTHRSVIDNDMKDIAWERKEKEKVKNIDWDALMTKQFCTAYAKSVKSLTVIENE